MQNKLNPHAKLHTELQNKQIKALGGAAKPPETETKKYQTRDAKWKAEHKQMHKLSRTQKRMCKAALKRNSPTTKQEANTSQRNKISKKVRTDTNNYKIKYKKDTKQ